METDRPKPPPDLAPEALAEWERVCCELDKTSKITRQDRAVLTLYVRIWATNHAAAVHVAKYGSVIKWPNGVPGPSPFFKVMVETGKQLRGLLADLTLTPASRATVKTAEPAEPAELDI